MGYSPRGLKEWTRPKQLWHTRVYRGSQGGWRARTPSTLPAAPQTRAFAHLDVQHSTTFFFKANPFRGSSQPRDRTQVSRIAGGFVTSWATREAQESWSGQPSLLH